MPEQSVPVTNSPPGVMTIDAAFNLAVQAHNAGRLDDAERIYRAIIQQKPEYLPAIANFGALCLNGGRLDDAWALFNQGRATAPFHRSMVDGCARVLVLKGDLAGAEILFRAAYENDPGSRNFYLQRLGNVAYTAGDNVTALQLLERYIELEPNPSADDLNLVAGLLHGQNRGEEACAMLDRALALKPYDEIMLRNRVIMARQHQDKAALESALRRAIAVFPNDVELRFSLTDILVVQNRNSEVEPLLRQLTIDAPNRLAGWVNLAGVLYKNGDFNGSLECGRRAMDLAPDNVQALRSAIIAAQRLGKIEEAGQMIRRAIALDPTNAKLHNDLGGNLHGEGKIKESVASFRRAMEMMPSNVEWHTNMIFTLDFDPDADLVSQQALRREWWERHGAHLVKDVTPPNNDPDPDRKLRVGYISGDLRRHSACYAFGLVILGRDAEQFDIYCYSNDNRVDDLSERLKEKSVAWRQIEGMNDAEVFDLIRADKIDILVDLSGHSAGNRLAVVAAKPAPVQATGWGHATGTGIKSIDYFFCDPVSLPQAYRHLFAEEVVDLPCLLGFMPPDPPPPVSPILPMTQGNPPTFGCLNRIIKMTDPVVELWARVLHAVPESRLILKDNFLSDAGQRDLVLRRFAGQGIGAERLVLMGGTAHADHLKVFYSIDLALDPFPSGGGVSTLEALNMGVPMITLLGRTIPSRLGASILQAIGQPEFIARDYDHYVELARDWIRNPTALAPIRAGLRDKLLGSPVGDAAAYAKAVENSYRMMWRRWCEKRQRGEA